MTIMGLRRLALWAGLVLMAACGGPLPEEMDTSELVSQEEVSQESELHENTLAACPFQGMEPCNNYEFICAAYCCDGSRHRRYLACGDGTAFALGVCGTRDGVWRIEWHET